MRLARLRNRSATILLLEALQVIEPQGCKAYRENSASGTPMIWGDIGLSELVPLVWHNGRRSWPDLARLVLGISAAPDGVVLMDEVENGIHHSVLPKVWRVIDTAAKQLNTQVFATTHSLSASGQRMNPYAKMTSGFTDLRPTTSREPLRHI